jgi:prepilin-type N-terminal cleavage/methylation domain-containing protein
MFFKEIKKEKGFTLLETLVTLFVFSVMMVIVGAVFIDSLNMQRKAFNYQQSQENANFALEFMAKEIRVSQISGPDTACPGAPSSILNLVHPINGNVTYLLSGNAIHRIVSGLDTIISSNTVQFTKLQFCIMGSAAGDFMQPKVTIITSVRSKSALQQATVDIQTTISQRLLSN